MAIQKPYYRIMRPIGTDDCFCPYILDNRYSNDLSMLCRSYNIIESDFKKIFEYIEPSDDNNEAYSHRTYELLLRSATEFETNCKGILISNGYTSKRDLNIHDYYKINNATRLSEYEVIMNVWHPNKLSLKPFSEWRTSPSLSWYRAYNDVKHNRQSNFKQAKIQNLVQAVASVFVILFAQFGAYSFRPYQQTDMVSDNSDGFYYLGESLFSIKPPLWPDAEKYNFDWSTLKTNPNPFVTYPF